MSSGGGGGDTTTTSEPWAGQKPYLQDLFKQAQGMFESGQGQQFYGGPLVAGFSPMTEQGIGQMYQRGAQGSQLQPGMNQFLNQSMLNPGGMAGVGTDMPGQNPYLDQMFGTVAQRAGEQFQEQTMPAIAAQFGGAGRTGGGIHQQVAQGAADDFSQNLLQQAGDIYGKDYTQAMDRDIQRRDLMGDIGFRGATLAPQSQSMEMQNIQSMLQAGALTEDQAQRMIDAERQRFDFYQQAPWQALGQYGNMVQGMPGGYGTTTAPGQQGNRFAGAAGGAMAGSQIMPGWGTAIGAGLGYLMS
jgi:hypothetical protein